MYFKAMPFIWKHLNPLTQGCFVPSLVEIGAVVLEEKILKHSSMYFRYFVIFSPWKRAWSFTSFWKSKFPLPKDALCRIWLKLVQYVVLEKKMKMWEVYRHTDGGQQAIRKAHLSIRFRWAKKTEHFYLGKIMSKTFR